MEVKPPPPEHCAFADKWLRHSYLQSCLEGIFVSQTGFAICEKGVRPSMQRLEEIMHVAKALGQTECDVIAMQVRMQNERRKTHAARRTAYIALGVAVISMLISLSPIL